MTIVKFKDTSDSEMYFAIDTLRSIAEDALSLMVTIIVNQGYDDEKAYEIIRKAEKLVSKDGA